MADLVEIEQWDTEVYQLETTDPVQGGVDGIDNVPHKSLANRTVWLKAQLALKALLGGDSTQLFKAADGLATDDVVTKGQLDLKVNLADTDVNSTANSIPIRDADTAISGKNQCTAWVTFNAQTGVILESYNIASFVVNGTGDYTFTLATEMATTDYCGVGQCHVSSGSNSGAINNLKITNRTTTTFKAYSNYTNASTVALYDRAFNSIIIFGGK